MSAGFQVAKATGVVMVLALVPGGPGEPGGPGGPARWVCSAAAIASVTIYTISSRVVPNIPDIVYNSVLI